MENIYTITEIENNSQTGECEEKLLETFLDRELAEQCARILVNNGHIGIFLNKRKAEMITEQELDIVSLHMNYMIIGECSKKLYDNSGVEYYLYMGEWYCTTMYNPLSNNVHLGKIGTKLKLLI